MLRETGNRRVLVGISEEACALRLLIRHGRRDAIRRFTSMTGLSTWPEASVFMAMQVLLSHGALLVDDPEDEDYTLGWAQKRLSAAAAAQQDTTALQHLVSLIEQHAATATRAASSSSSHTSTEWGSCPAADVRAVMQHVLRYARDQQRRALSHHPHCATAALAAAAGMGPQMRDVVHWMLAIAANVDGLDLRQLRRKPKRRRPAPKPPAPDTGITPSPAASPDGPGASTMADHPSAAACSLSSEIQGDCTYGPSTTSPPQASPAAQQQEALQQQLDGQHNGACNGLVQTTGQQAENGVGPAVPSPQCDIDGNSNSTCTSNGNGWTHHQSETPHSPPTPAGCQSDGEGDVNAFLKCVSTEAQNGCEDSSCIPHVSEIIPLCNGADSEHPAKQHLSMQTAQHTPDTNGNMHTMEPAPYETHNGVSPQPAAPEPAADDDTAFVNPFMAMQQQFAQQHAAHHAHGPSHGHHHHHHQQPLDGCTELDLSEPLSAAGAEPGSAAGDDEEEEDSGVSWMDFLDAEFMQRRSSQEELSEEVQEYEAEEEEGTGEGMEEEVDKWVLSPLAEAAAAGDRYLVELLLEVHGADAAAYGGLAERQARASGHNMIAKLIYEKSLAQAAARGQQAPAPRGLAGNEPGSLTDSKGGDPANQGYQYVTLGDWVRSQLPSWNVSRWFARGQPAPRGDQPGNAVVYKSQGFDGHKGSPALRYARVGLALGAAATLGFFLYTCVNDGGPAGARSEPGGEPVQSPSRSTAPSGGAASEHRS